MKFANHKYWRHRGDCCDFLEVLEVLSDNGEEAELVVSWNNQLHKSWRTLVSRMNIRIMKNDYRNWRAIIPRGVYVGVVS